MYFENVLRYFVATNSGILDLFLFDRSIYIFLGFNSMANWPFPILNTIFC